jgi:hypothetical protein
VVEAQVLMSGADLSPEGISSKRQGHMGDMNRILLGVFVVFLVLIGGGVAVLAAWDIPAPVHHQEVPVPNDRLSLQ